MNCNHKGCDAMTRWNSASMAQEKKMVRRNDREKADQLNTDMAEQEIVEIRRPAFAKQFLVGVFSGTSAPAE
jgi:hypothetical protein